MAVFSLHSAFMKHALPLKRKGVGEFRIVRPSKLQKMTNHTQISIVISLNSTDVSSIIVVVSSIHDDN